MVSAPARMRIIRYFPRAWSGDGGITNSVRRISEGLARAGAQVRIAVDEPAARVATDAEAPRNGAPSWLPIQHEGPPRFRRPVDLESPLREADVLVVHSAWVYHNIRAAAAARRLGIPYVLEPRGAYDPRILRRRRLLKRVWWWSFERRLVRRSAAVHIFFESEREHLRAIGYTGPVVVVPNGIEPPEGVAWDGGSGGYLLWIGRFDPEHKGLDLLLEAVGRLPRERRPVLRLHGPDWAGGKERVKAMVDALELGDHVIVGEPVYGDAKWTLLSRAAAFVYPSRWEGFGNSAAEAVSAGVPTLVTPYPFGRWLAERGAAILADPEPESLARGLRRVLSRRGAAAAERGRRLLSEELSWDAVARSWLRQVEAIL